MIARLFLGLLEPGLTSESSIMLMGDAIAQPAKVSFPITSQSSCGNAMWMVAVPNVEKKRARHQQDSPSAKCP